jgi:hypothetical protein
MPVVSFCKNARVLSSYDTFTFEGSSGNLGSMRHWNVLTASLIFMAEACGRTTLLEEQDRRETLSSQVNTTGSFPINSVIGSGGNSMGGSGNSTIEPWVNGGSFATGGSITQVAVCGNGIIESGEECDAGLRNRNTPAFWVSQGSVGFEVLPMMRFESALDFYDYYSVSAHTGWEDAGISRIFLYLEKATLALSLVVFHGIDRTATGIEQPKSQVTFSFAGLPESTVVELSDDFEELSKTSTTTAIGNWGFRANTDGGVLSSLPFPGSWEVTITPSFIEGISRFTWVIGDNQMAELDLRQPLLIKASDKSSVCRTNCTLPRCGDRILDGGERCDDKGLTEVGCTNDCQAFE